jgi:hypothetical protein
VSKIDKVLDPQKRADLAVVDVVRRVQYSGLVTMMSDEQFVGAASIDGKPTVWYDTTAATVARDYEWRTRTKPVQYDDIFRTRMAIVIDQHMTQGVRTTPEQERFDQIRYATDVLPPATEALANRLNSKIVDALLTTTDFKTTNLVLGGAGALDENIALAQLIEIQLILDAQGMPRAGRRLVAGKNVYKFLAGSKLLRSYDLSQATSVFRRGVRGNLDIVDMELVNGVDLLGDNAFYVVHPSWAVMPTSAGELPDNGVAWARRSSVEGFALRIQRGYSMDWDRNGQVIHTYYKVNPVNDEIQRHTRATAAAANDGSVAGDPVITSDALVTTGKNVRIASGTYTTATNPA